MRFDKHRYLRYKVGLENGQKTEIRYSRRKAWSSFLKNMDTLISCRMLAVFQKITNNSPKLILKVAVFKSCKNFRYSVPEEARVVARTL